MGKYNINPLKKIFDLYEPSSSSGVNFFNYFSLPISFDDVVSGDFVVNTDTQVIRISYDYTTLTSYIGEATSGSGVGDSVWRIKRISVSGDTTSIIYADSANEYSKIWSNKETYSYA